MKLLNVTHYIAINIENINQWITKRFNRLKKNIEYIYIYIFLDIYLNPENIKNNNLKLFISMRFPVISQR